MLTLFPHWPMLAQELLECWLQTCLMVVVSGTVAWILGLFFGTLLVVTADDGLMPKRWLFTLLDRSIDILRAIPFIILIVLLIPVSRFLLGTGSGVTGSFIALIVGTVPFFARQIETVLSTVPRTLIEAAQTMGLPLHRIVVNVYWREARIGIIRVTMITFVSFIGISAIAGAIGAGGIGDFAIRYGYQMGYRDMMWLTVLIILAMISSVQALGNYLIRRLQH